jgi:hypothetical protein
MLNGHEPPARITTRPGDEPVHDAIVAARLADLQGRIDLGGAVIDEAIGGAGGNPRRRGVLHRLRLRVGHALMAVGSFVAGAPERSEAPRVHRPA